MGEPHNEYYTEQISVERLGADIFQRATEDGRRFFTNPLKTQSLTDLVRKPTSKNVLNAMVRVEKIAPFGRVCKTSSLDLKGGSICGIRYENAYYNFDQYPVQPSGWQATLQATNPLGLPLAYAIVQYQLASYVPYGAPYEEGVEDGPKWVCEKKGAVRTNGTGKATLTFSNLATPFDSPWGPQTIGGGVLEAQIFRGIEYARLGLVKDAGIPFVLWTNQGRVVDREYCPT